MKVLAFLITIGLLMVSIIISLFSYFFVEHGLVSMLTNSHPVIGNLYAVINFTNSNRPRLASIYLVLILILFCFQILILWPKLKQYFSTRSLFVIGGFTTLIFALGYPFLSNDFFAYLFSEKTILDYHANPYQVPPQTFIDKELWFSFLRNIEVTYPYGPVSLLYYLIPIFILSTKRFILDYFGVKLLGAIIFFLTGLLAYKLNNRDFKTFSLWFFNPFLVIELLINSHNDLIMISLFVISAYFLSKKKIIHAGFFLVLSILTKFGSFLGLPLLFLSDKRRILLFKLLSLGVMVFLQIQTVRPVLAWYYAWAYMFLLFARLRIWSWIIISLMGLLLMVNYYPFLKLGNWHGSALIPNAQLIFNVLALCVVLTELDFPFKIIRLRLFNFHNSKSD